MITIKQIIDTGVEHDCSDIHLSEGRPVEYRCQGTLTVYDPYVMTHADVKSVCDQMLNERTRATLDKCGEVDFAFALENCGRLRCNVYMESGRLAAAMRLLPFSIPTTTQCGTPPAAVHAASRQKGLLLVTGPTGHGKSTTQAALIHHLNRHHQKHIITLEDPVEYVHTSDKCIIHQREVGVDTGSFSAALRAALRQDPDVILVGEMRDTETISIALTAAETGHLVIATLHTNNTSSTIDRIIDAFPAEQQAQIRVQLSTVLECVVCQNLVPTVDGKRVAVYEVLMPTMAVRNMIRENKTPQIPSALQTGKKFGMQTKDDHLYELFLQGKISKETALKYAEDEQQLTRRLESFGGR